MAFDPFDWISDDVNQFDRFTQDSFCTLGHASMGWKLGVARTGIAQPLVWLGVLVQLGILCFSLAGKDRIIQQIVRFFVGRE